MPDAGRRTPAQAAPPGDGSWRDADRSVTARLSFLSWSRTVTEPGHGRALRPAVIWSPNQGVLAVSAAGVLCAFCRVLDTLPGQCLRRRPCANPLVADAFRTKRLLCERCSATCP